MTSDISLSTSFSLLGKTALITGASGGLGLHFARTLAKAGAYVILAARRTDVLLEAVSQLRKDGYAAHSLCMDVTLEASIIEGFKQIELLSPTGIDIVINNAGISREGMADTMLESDWQAVIDTNLTGPWLVSKHYALSRRSLQASGVIIHIGSILGDRAAQGVSAYCAAKAGLHHLTQAQALEWARHNIRVNTLAPGYIETDLNRVFFSSAPGQKLISRMPAKRLGQASELDGALLLLASDAGSFINGTVLTVDGGHTGSTL